MQGSSVLQRFSVPFEYPVLFTRGVFVPSNRLLAETIRGRVLIVVDKGASDAAPELGSRITDYFKAHADRLELAADPLLVDGGEACKNDPTAPLLLAEA